MGTRASFWIGDPKNLDNREWLGCIAWDGDIGNFLNMGWGDIDWTEEKFRQAVRSMNTRRDFAHPGNGWPFPWHGDIFLTDCTYAFYDGKLWACWMDKFFLPIEAHKNPDDDSYYWGVNPAHKNVPAPEPYNPDQPDSIMRTKINPAYLE